MRVVVLHLLKMNRRELIIEAFTVPDLIWCDELSLAVAESCLVSDELLQYRHFVSKQQFDKDLSDEQEEEVLAQFASLDPEKKGHIEWSDFLYFESLAVLRKFRSEV